MGNQACCLRPRRNREDPYRVTHATTSNGGPARQTSIPVSPPSKVPHIIERGQSEFDDDPSNHPLTEPLFTSKSKPDLVKYANERRRRSGCESMNGAGDGSSSMKKKFSSCSTIYIDDSTVSHPNLKNTIKAVALAIYYHIRKRGETDSTLDIFDELQHPLSKEPVPEDYSRRDPDHRQIYRFIRTLFSAAQLTAECAIVTLVYLERLLIYAEIGLLPSNWRRITLGAILLASKVWDDQAVWNVDFCQILKDMSVEDMNELERVFLEQLEFNINVPSSVYVKYYFDLRALLFDLSVPTQLLSRSKAVRLEAIGGLTDSRPRTNSSVSLNKLTTERTIVILN